MNFIFLGQLSQYSTASASSCHLSYFTFLIVVMIYMLLYKDFSFFQHVLPPRKNINIAVFRFHKQLCYSMHISCCNIIVCCQTEESVALITVQKLATFKGLFTFLIFFICGLFFLMPFIRHCVITKLPSFFLILILFTKTTFILLQFVKLIKYTVFLNI